MGIDRGEVEEIDWLRGHVVKLTPADGPARRHRQARSQLGLVNRLSHNTLTPCALPRPLGER